MQLIFCKDKHNFSNMKIGRYAFASHPFIFPTMRTARIAATQMPMKSHPKPVMNAIGANVTRQISTGAMKI